MEVSILKNSKTQNLVCICIFVVLCVSCKIKTIENLIVEEELDEFGYFLNIADTSSICRYNLFARQSKVLLKDSVLYFLTFKGEIENPEDYFVIVNDGEIKIFRSHLKEPESFCSEIYLSLIYQLDEEFIKDTDFNIELFQCEQIIWERNFSVDSTINLTGLWQGVKKYGTSGKYIFYCELNNKRKIARHYCYYKTIFTRTDQILNSVLK